MKFSNIFSILFQTIAFQMFDKVGLFEYFTVTI